MMIEVDMVKLIHQNNTDQEGEFDDIDLDIEGVDQNNDPDNQMTTLEDAETERISINPHQVTMIQSVGKDDNFCLLFLRGLEPILLKEDRGKLRKKLTKAMR